jgi:hypothetical protein
MTTLSLLRFREWPRELSGTVDEKLRYRADETVFQGHYTDRAGLDQKVNWQGLQTQALATQPQDRDRRH